MSTWEELGEAWRATRETVDVATLRTVVASHRRRLILVTGAEIAIVLAFAALSAFAVSDGIEPWEAIWLVTLWGFTLIAVAFAISNRRGTWRTLGESVDEYVRMTRLRAERRLRSARFACALFVAEVIAVVAQLAWFDRFTLVAASTLAASALAIGVWCFATKRSIARELRMVEEYGGGEG